MNRISVFNAHINEAINQSGKTREEIFQLIKTWGISGLDCDISDLTPDFSRTVHSAGLEISSVYGTFSFQDGYDERSARRFIDKAADSGAKTVLCVAGFTEDKGKYINIADGLKKICAYAKKRDIKVSVEDYDDKSSPFSTCAGIKFFLDNVPELYVTFDTGNFVYSCENELSAFETLRDRIVHVHLKDRSLVSKPGETPKIALDRRALYSSPVGSGSIKIREILGMLLEEGYNGYFAIEHFGSMNQLGDIAASADYITKFITTEKKND